MTARIPLYPGELYHIYNWGNNRENIFYEPRNYRYFLELYAKYLDPWLETYAYCLLPNHFHLVVRVRQPEDNHIDSLPGLISKQFATFFGTYTKAINAAYPRSGRLFSDRFQRKRVEKEAYFIQLIKYVHHNPQKHHLVDNFLQWPHSSYKTITSHHPTRLARQAVLEGFGGLDAFVEAHAFPVNEGLLEGVLIE